MSHVNTPLQSENLREAPLETSLGNLQALGRISELAEELQLSDQAFKKRAPRTYGLVIRFCPLDQLFAKDEGSKKLRPTWHHINTISQEQITQAQVTALALQQEIQNLLELQAERTRAAVNKAARAATGN